MTFSQTFQNVSFTFGKIQFLRDSENFSSKLTGFIRINREQVIDFFFDDNCIDPKRPKGSKCFVTEFLKFVKDVFEKRQKKGG